MVREMGLEPTRRNHTHLKRACLPFQHSRKCHSIICFDLDFVKAFLCFLQKNKTPFVIGFIADQVPTWEAINHWLTFFHQDTPVFTGTEKIARRTSSAVFYMSLHREKHGHYVATFHKLCEDASQTIENELTNKYFALLEENIKEEPHLWLWTHKRWKRTRKGYAEREAKRARDLQKLKERSQS